MAKLETTRARKMSSQRGRCYYCKTPMWARDPRRFSERHGVTMRSVKHFQRTAEHLVARCDGGTDDPDNIVAACHYCNQERHKAKAPLPADAWLARVRERVARGRWRTQKRNGPGGRA